MNQSEYLDFNVFLARFTIVDPPVQVDDETYHEINEIHEPLPNILVSAFVERKGADEDLAEYVPVFRLPDLHNFVCLVFWRAGVLQYDYILAIFTQEGARIDQKVVASTIYSQEKTIKSVAKFDEEGMVTVIEGIEDAKTGELVAANSKQLFFEILENGTIQQSTKFSI